MLSVHPNDREADQLQLNCFSDVRSLSKHQGKSHSLFRSIDNNYRHFCGQPRYGTL